MWLIDRRIYLGLADMLERHISPPYSSPGNDWRGAKYFFISSVKTCCPHYFGSFGILYTRLAITPAPYGAIGNDIQPLRLWTKGYSVS